MHRVHAHHQRTHRLRAAMGVLLLAGFAVMPITASPDNMMGYHHHHLLSTVSVLVDENPDEELGDANFVITPYLGTHSDAVGMVSAETAPDVHSAGLDLHTDIDVMSFPAVNTDDVGIGLLSLTTMGLPPVWSAHHFTVTAPFVDHQSGSIPAGTIDLLAGSSHLSTLGLAAAPHLANTLPIDLGAAGDLSDIGTLPDIPLP